MIILNVITFQFNVFRNVIVIFSFIVQTFVIIITSFIKSRA